MKLDVLGSKTNYQSIPGRLPAVLLHGWGCDWQIWFQQIAIFSGKFNLIIPDLPAFGKSEIPSGKVWGSLEYVSWLKSFLDKVVTDKPFVLVGHSFGGKIAALYTQKHDPKNLRLLVLVDASGLPMAISTPRRAASKAVSLIPDKAKNLVGMNLKTKLLTKLGVGIDNLNSTPSRKKILQKVVHENITSELKKIKKDTLLIWGENDKDTPLSKGVEMNALIPNSKLETICHSGHFPFIEQKDKFNSLLLKYISIYPELMDEQKYNFSYHSAK